MHVPSSEDAPIATNAASTANDIPAKSMPSEYGKKNNVKKHKLRQKKRREHIKDFYLSGTYLPPELDMHCHRPVSSPADVHTLP